ncbi:MAG: SPOR domain-containing protein [Pseudomonadota bacterium]|nr:SPOR domain-containing protein [Pseudomonadota bacterium]
MKWLAILLMIANVALYLWMSGHQGESGIGDMPAKPEVNRSGMLLLSEIRKPAAEAIVVRESNVPASGQPPAPAGSAAEIGDKAPPALVATPDRGEAAVQKAAPEKEAVGDGNTAEPQRPTLRHPTAAPAPTTPAVTPAQQNTEQETACFRVGPFKVKQLLNAVSIALRQEGVRFRVVQSKGRELKATRVYLGPYASRAEAGAMIERLKSMGLPAYIYRSDGGQLRVSLGYFTQEGLATKYTAALEQKGVQAKIEPEFKMLGPFDWLEIRVRRGDAGSIKGRNWGEREVEVKTVACPA